jgi:hypothetical protein
MINPTTISRLWSDKEFLLTQSVDSVFISNVDHSPILACDVFTSESAERKRAFLHAANVPYLNFEGDSDERLSGIAKNAAECVGEGKNDLLRTAGSRSQWVASASLVQLLGENFTLFPEPKLTVAFELSDYCAEILDVHRKIAKSMFKTSDIKRMYPEMLNFDGLICTAPPYAIPLVAFEYDGPDHHATEQKIKDLLKEIVCWLAGVDFIRISSTWGDHKKSEFEKNLRGRFLAELPPYILRRQLSSRWFYYTCHSLMRSKLRFPDSDPEQNVPEEMFRLSEMMGWAYDESRRWINERASRLRNDSASPWEFFEPADDNVGALGYALPPVPKSDRSGEFRLDNGFSSIFERNLMLAWNATVANKEISVQGAITTSSPSARRGGFEDRELTPKSFAFSNLFAPVSEDETVEFLAKELKGEAESMLRVEQVKLLRAEWRAAESNNDRIQIISDWGYSAARGGFHKPTQSERLQKAIKRVAYGLDKLNVSPETKHELLEHAEHKIHQWLFDPTSGPGHISI